jgi:carboxylesterase type B
MTSGLTDWKPTIDGWLLTDSPYRLYQQGKSLPIPILAGSTTDEGTIFVPNFGNLV